MPIDFENNDYAGFPAGENKKEKEIKEVKQIITAPEKLASAINEIGYSNILNIISCNSYDGCIIVVLYR